jgi:hypothetical protein
MPRERVGISAVALSLVLAAAVEGLLCPPHASAAFSGSPHDFSSTGPAPNDLARSGSCAACHAPHDGDPLRAWSRPLVEENAFYNQNSDPNYRPGSTILCYDCHDDNPDRTSVLIDDDPSRGTWDTGHAPQNIAFTDVVPSGYQTAPTRPGYYELVNGVVPSSGNHGPVDGSATGGHYWKVARTGKPEYRRGDKIACSFCHDPHAKRTGRNEALLLTNAGDDGSIPIGDNLAAARPPNTRNGTGNGRGMCAACHAYSQTGTPATFRSVALPRPPTTVAEHREADTTACTNCHEHNRVDAACDTCHGFPPTTAGNGWSGPGDTDENYPGGAGAHLAHIKGAGNPATAPSLYDFGCLGGACHPNTQHDQGKGTVARANVQVSFDPAWNPNGLFSAGGSAGADICTQLYCHSNGLVENGANPADGGTGEAGASGLGEWAEHSGKPTFFGVTPASTTTWAGSLGCQGCHGKGNPLYRFEQGATSSTKAVSSPAYLNAGTQAGLTDNQPGIFNTTGANTHYIHVYKLPSSIGGTCSCHGSDAVAAPPNHVNRQVDIAACANSCHNTATYAWGAKLGTDTADSCVFWCHGKMPAYDSAGGRVTKNGASGLPLDAQPKYMKSGHGLPSSATYDSGLPGAGLKCSDCHLATDRFTTNGPLEAAYHYERHALSTGNAAAGLAANPYWLKGSYATDPDGLCASCHNGTTASGARNHSAQGMIDFAGYDPKYDAPPGTWTTFTPNCIGCHDPHGEPNWFMLYDADPEKSASGSTPTFSGPVIYKGSRFGVTRVPADQYGFPPGPPYAAGQAPVTMTGRSSGTDFAPGNGSGICEVCHTLTGYFRRDGTSPAGAHYAKACIGCHEHRNSFPPSGCEDCHGKRGSVSPGANGRPDDGDDAPNVMTAKVGASWLSVWDGTWWDQTQGGAAGAQQGGHGDPGGREGGVVANTPACASCHDTDQPPDTHFDGVYNSLGTELPMPSNPSTPRPKASPNTNTAHLKPEYFTKYVLGSGNDASWQRAVDSYCYLECHKPAQPSVSHHDHTNQGNVPVDGTTQLGIHLTKPATDAAVMDSDLTTDADGAPNFVPCVGCHNPHGTTAVEPTSPTNRMVLDAWKTPPTLCARCHI